MKKKDDRAALKPVGVISHHTEAPLECTQRSDYGHEMLRGWWNSLNGAARAHWIAYSKEGLDTLLPLHT